MAVHTITGVLLVATLIAACHRVNAPASVVNVAQPATANQLLFGFYGVEMHSWRWTARRFAVALAPPRNAAQQGAKLILRLYVPAIQIRKIGPMTLSAEIAGWPLLDQTFSKEGTYAYIRDVPSTLLDTNIVPVDFSFDKSTGQLQGEGRELGTVVTSIELQAK